ncbi:MAG: fructosamine kinase family protein [Burkholderiales bacterium]
MPLWSDIAAAIRRASGAFEIEVRAPLAGGCIHDACRIEGGGQRYFVKTNRAECIGMFAAEAAGLEAIAATGALRVPRPVCHDANREASWLVLEYIELERKGSGRRLGERLAALHRATGERYGWPRFNYIGALPQINTLTADWCAFWREHRLGYQLKLAASNGYTGRLQELGERLMAHLPALLDGHAPPPSLLHGDLWSGNAAFAAGGEPVVFDPAVYYGDREADLAMTELFGGFGADFYTAYREAYPLEEGYARRKTLYNLYHVLNHLNLFGGGYLAQAEAMMEKLLAHA